MSDDELRQALLDTARQFRDLLVATSETVERVGSTSPVALDTMLQALFEGQACLSDMIATVAEYVRMVEPDDVPRLRSAPDPGD